MAISVYTSHEITHLQMEIRLHDHDKMACSPKTSNKHYASAMKLSEVKNLQKNCEDNLLHR